MNEPEEQPVSRPRLRGGVLAVLALGAVVAVAAVVAATRDGSDAVDRDPLARVDGSSTGRSSADPDADTSSPSGRRPVPGFGFGEVALVVIDPDGGRRVLCVMRADTEAQRARGLMEVLDETLGGYDGMIFLYPVEHSGGFWMRNTPMPLSIAYLSASGEIVSTTDMAPCGDRPSCVSYPPDGPYRSALEVPKGRLDDLGVVAGATVEVAGTCAPSTSD